MPTILSVEYENQNSRRRYPFADGASLLDTDGKALPPDFLLDAHLYPLDPRGEVYLSSIDTSASVIYFADTATGIVFGKAGYKSDSRTADVVEVGVAGRQVGVLVFGAGLAEAGGGRATRYFSAEASVLTPTAYTPIRQVGVRGIRLPDGSLVVGDVTFEGRDGVTVTSRIEDGRHILRFDVFGVPDIPENCGEPPLVRSVIVERAPNSRFSVSKYDDYTLALSAVGPTLDELCETARLRKRPDSRDPCVTPPPVPVDPPSGEAVTLRYALCDMRSGAFNIVAPSAVGAHNPVTIETTEIVAPPNRMTVPPVTTPEDATRAAESFRLPDSGAGGITIGIQGVGKGQLP